MSVSSTEDFLTDPVAAACDCGPLATRRKRLGLACRCAGRVLWSGTDRRLHALVETGQRYADRRASLADVEVALRDADAAAEAARRAAEPVWTIFEGRRAAAARAEAGTAHKVIAAFRWALGRPDGEAPPAPAAWLGVRAALAAYAPTACDPAWLTADVLALARAVQDGHTDALPILADALQDAGCDDEYILDHCRGPRPHGTGCWVPDLLLDGD